MIEGFSHITFIVSDLDRMENLLTTVFDAKEVYSSGEKTFSISKEKLFLINGLWIAIMEGQPLRDKTYNHGAFKIVAKNYEEYLARV